MNLTSTDLGANHYDKHKAQQIEYAFWIFNINYRITVITWL